MQNEFGSMIHQLGFSFLLGTALTVFSIVILVSRRVSVREETLLIFECLSRSLANFAEINQF